MCGLGGPTEGSIAGVAWLESRRYEALGCLFWLKPIFASQRMRKEESMEKSRPASGRVGRAAGHTRCHAAEHDS